MQNLLLKIVHYSHYPYTHSLYFKIGQLVELVNQLIVSMGDVL